MITDTKKRRIVQIAHVVRDIDRAMRHYYEILGIGPWEVYTFGPPKLRECTYMGKPSEATWVLALTWVGDNQLELMQPLSGENVYTTFLAENGEGFHHIKEWVDDCAETIEAYRQKGVEVIQSGKYEQDEFYYLDTLKTLGVIYEIGNNGEIGPPERVFPQ